MVVNMPGRINEATQLLWGKNAACPLWVISRHEAEIDDFVNDAITELEEIRLDAKKALTAATSH
jgi:hypothetical protein